MLRITADARYHLYVNGTPVGFGPVRSWPNHWKLDEYDLSPYLRDGANVIAVLVRHFGTGTFQYIPAAPGLAAEVLAGPRSKKVALSWRSSIASAYPADVPRISLQLGFEEQFDARLEDEWKMPGYDDAGWSPVVPVKSPHGPLEPRGIPFLTREEVLPVRILATDTVKPVSQTWTLPLRSYFLEPDQAASSNFGFGKGFALTYVAAERAEKVEFIRPHRHTHPFKVNGALIPALPGGFAEPVRSQEVSLRKGWNAVLFPITNFPPGGESENVGGSTHLAEFVLAVRSKQGLRWASSPHTEDGAGSSPWLYLGPFEFTEGEKAAMTRHMDHPRVGSPRRFHPEATAERFLAIWKAGATEANAFDGLARPVTPADAIQANVFAEAVADTVVGPARLDDPEAILGAGGGVAVLHPAGDGHDVRVLLDFGREVVGMHAFEVEAAAGTILDFHNFEFIQPDGRHNLTEGMNNTLRYVCREGWQRFESTERRGFRYSWLIVRGASRPVRIRKVATIFSTYPQQRLGSFQCSDEKLNRIWEVGAHTLRCCAEDTYTDCPTYEQTHWVGDARNEALVDWVVNGDPRLWFRCLEQTGQSLEHFPITGSEVPSSWENILPAWSFLWMRSCREYLLWTGDFAGSRRLFPFVAKNVEGIRAHLDQRGLFAMQAWNLFDWAAMDTPTRGAVTHNNCFIVLALRECAELAKWLKEGQAARSFEGLAEEIATAVNKHLWDRKRRAYIDCIHADGRASQVCSQQTHTVALSSGVATGARARRCREILHNPPEDFVRAGSPFFEFFLLEALSEEGKEKDFLDTIRRDWGFMIEQGATTFWEMWSIKGGRLTRSHCHGWSAAPTFFLSSTVLGVTPVAPGCREIVFDPRLGDLVFVRGEVPTPYGLIRVHCARDGEKVEARIETPRGVKVRSAAAGTVK